MLLGIALHGLLSFIPIPIWPAQDVNQSEFYGIPLMMIHGFRMSLFFFVSGFFTMMMWQKRGTLSLLNHRFKRIVIPFFLCCVILVPLQNKMGWINEWWNGEEELSSERNQDQISESNQSIGAKKKTAKDIWEASRAGDLEELLSFLGSGIDPNEKDAKQITPLHWAAGTGQIEVMHALIDAGAEVNARDGSRSTPLHFAAFLGQPKSVRILLKKGADSKLKNQYESVPLWSAYTDKKTTKSTAEDFLNLAVQFDEIKKGRKEVIRILGGKPAQEKDDWFARTYILNGQFITHHFWFLYDLLYLIVGFVALAGLLKFLPFPRLLSWLAESPLRLLWLIPLTWWVQYCMRENFGPDTTVTLEPDWIKLGYFAIFFGYGAICFGHSGFIEKAGRLWPVYFVLAVPAFIIGMSLMEAKGMEHQREIASFAGAAYAWLMILGMIGLFRRFFSKKNSKVRYLSDSAYWLYLAHILVLQIIQIWVTEWPLPSLLKFVFVCIATTGLLLLSYRYLIRFTWVGTMLNGKRHRADGAG